MSDVMHCNAAGIMGGNSVCGANGGSCCDDEWRVDCPACLKAMIEYLIGRGKSDAELARIFHMNDGTEFWYRMGLKQVALIPPKEWETAYTLGRKTGQLKQ